MSEDGYLKKFGGDKIALLGLFIVALISAYLIVGSKSTIILSEPIELPYAGLSVSVPHGNGWQTNGRWIFHESSYTLGSSFALSNQKPSAWALCRYRIVTETIGPKDLFEHRALEIDGQLVTTDHIENDALVIDCAYITNNRLPIHMFLGTIRLPNNHQFDIEIHESAGDVILAEETFKRMIESVSFEGNELLRTGAEIIANLKSEGVNSYLGGQNHQTLFFIEDARRHTIGFIMDVIADSDREDKFNIKASNLLYVRGSNAQEQISSFQSDDKFDEFTWKSETFSQIGKSSAEITLDKTGVVTIRKTGYGSLENSYRLSTAAIPDILLDFFFVQMFERDQKQAQVDMIKADGKITPTLITRIDNEEDSIIDNNAAYILKLEFLDGRGTSEKLYLNQEKKVFERLVQQDEPYILKSATVEQVIKEFPERADDVLESTRIIRQNTI